MPYVIPVARTSGDDSSPGNGSKGTTDGDSNRPAAGRIPPYSGRPGRTARCPRGIAKRPSPRRAHPLLSTARRRYGSGARPARSAPSAIAPNDRRPPPETTSRGNCASPGPARSRHLEIRGRSTSMPRSIPTATTPPGRSGSVRRTTMTAPHSERVSPDRSPDPEAARFEPARLRAAPPDRRFRLDRSNLSDDARRAEVR